jgi:spermidine/putrescine ABC transporter ATP-binding subunit
VTDVILENVSYRYGGTPAVDAVNLHIKSGEFFALLGPSGSGKTTLLRLAAGFIKPQAGRIIIDNEEVQDVPVHRRNIGFVFQNYALFPHLTVEQNIAFGLESQRAPRTIVKERVKEMLALVQLSGYEKRRPSQLSGGQQQRVALVRALANQPRVLLLDEPLAALDRKLRTEMQVELRELQKRLGITTIFVTHDQEEAMTLADRIAVLRAGRIVQIGEPLEVYECPRDAFVATFLGMSNVITGTATDVNESRVQFTAADVTLTADCAHQVVIKRGMPVEAMVRPERVKIHLEPPPASSENVMPAFIHHISYLGSGVTYHLSTEQYIQLLAFEQNGLRNPPLRVGQQVFASWQPGHMRVLETPKHERH